MHPLNFRLKNVGGEKKKKKKKNHKNISIFFFFPEIKIHFLVWYNNKLVFGAIKIFLQILKKQTKKKNLPFLQRSIEQVLQFLVCSHRDG